MGWTGFFTGVFLAMFLGATFTLLTGASASVALIVGALFGVTFPVVGTHLEERHWREKVNSSKDRP